MKLDTKTNDTVCLPVVGQREQLARQLELAQNHVAAVTQALADLDACLSALSDVGFAPDTAGKVEVASDVPTDVVPANVVL